MTHHPFAHDDAAYVLGALEPAERADFERHLAGCADCRRRVAEVAPLPALLAGLSEHDLAGLSEHDLSEHGLSEHDLAERDLGDDPAAPDEAVPDTLLPRLLAAARAERHRRRRVTTALAGLAAACVAALAITVAVVARPADGGPAPQAMAAVTASPVHATATLRQRAWGTEIDLLCRYDGAGTGYPYRLVVRDRSGRSEVLGTWTLGPGREVRYRSGTALARDEIAAVEIGTVDGRTVLRLTT